MGFVQRYQKRVSDVFPLMNHTDIQLEVQRMPFEKLADLDHGEPSSTIRTRVKAERTVQAERVN